MSDRNSEYGIVTKNALLLEVKSQSSRTILLGTVFKVETVLDAKTLYVRFLKDGETWESVTFLIARDDVAFVHERLWSFLAAVTSPKERVKLALNTKKCRKLIDISVDMTVGFDDHNDIYLGTVKYKGNVKGMGKCFGIQLYVCL